jgi:hypothetical protein
MMNVFKALQGSPFCVFRAGSPLCAGRAARRDPPSHIITTSGSPKSFLGRHPETTHRHDARAARKYRLPYRAAPRYSGQGKLGDDFGRGDQTASRSRATHRGAARSARGLRSRERSLATRNVLPAARGCADQGARVVRPLSQGRLHDRDRVLARTRGWADRVRDAKVAERGMKAKCALGPPPGRGEGNRGTRLR